MSLAKRSLVVAVSVLILLVPLAVLSAQGVSWERDLDFDVAYYEVHPYNDTHVDFGIKVKVTNLGKYDNFVYKKSFYFITESGKYYLSKTEGSFKLYSQMFRSFNVNFTIPANLTTPDPADHIPTLYYAPPDGDDDYDFPLIPESAREKDGKELGTWDVILIVVIGIAFLAVLGLVYLVTSYSKRKQRRGKFLN